jgi:hypothetical protein
MIEKLIEQTGKALKNSVILTVILTVFISGLMLCCQVGLLSSGHKTAKSASCCQSSSVAQFKVPKAKTCGCCSLTKSVSEQAREAFTLSHLLEKTLGNSFLVAVDLFHFAPHNSLVVLADQGPPRFKTSSPIYLQVRNLRL